MEKGIAELLKQRKSGYASPFDIAALALSGRYDGPTTPNSARKIRRSPGSHRLQRARNFWKSAKELNRID